MVDNAGQLKRHTVLRKHSRREREAWIGTGELDPELDSIVDATTSTFAHANAGLPKRQRLLKNHYCLLPRPLKMRYFPFLQQQVSSTIRLGAPLLISQDTDGQKVDIEGVHVQSIWAPATSSTCLTNPI